MDFLIAHFTREALKVKLTGMFSCFSTQIHSFPRFFFFFIKIKLNYSIKTASSLFFLI